MFLCFTTWHTDGCVSIILFNNAATLQGRLNPHIFRPAELPVDDLAAEEKIMTCFIRHRETTATFAERREGRKEEKVGRLKSNNTSSPLFSPSAAGLWLPHRMENATLHCRDFPSLPLIQLFFTSALVCMLGTDSSSPSNNETEKMKGEPKSMRHAHGS